jgi:hypothetical protein
VDLKDVIEMEAQGLDRGTSTRIICPFCNDPERSMSITLEDSYVLFHCFRASCGKKGRINLGGVFKSYQEYEKKQTTLETVNFTIPIKLWEEATYTLPYVYYIDNSVAVEAYTKYHKAKDILITKTPKGYALKRVGQAGYRYLNNSKSKMYGENIGQVLLGTSENDGDSSYLVIVEDIISAMWVYQCLDTEISVMCLFGTNFPMSRYPSFSNMFNTFKWWLDPDTNYGYQKFAQIRTEMPVISHSFTVLETDPKNLTESEVKTTFGVK